LKTRIQKKSRVPQSFVPIPCTQQINDMKGVTGPEEGVQKQELFPILGESTMKKKRAFFLRLINRRVKKLRQEMLGKRVERLREGGARSRIGNARGACVENSKP